MTDRRSLLAAVGLSVLPGCSGPSSAAPTTGGTLSFPVGDVLVGGGLIVKESRVVVTQPTAGTFKAFSSNCPHQRCPVTAIEKAEIVCKCHTSHFALSDGRVTSGPSQEGLTEYRAAVRGNAVVVSR